MFEQKTRITSILDKYGRLKEFKSAQFSRGLSVGKTSDLRKGFEYQRVAGLDVYKEAEYKDLFTVGFERNLLPRDNILRVDASQTKLINKILDLRSQKGYVKPANIKKTPFSKTFAPDKVDDIVFEITGKPTASDYKKVIDKLDDVGRVATPKKSDFYGTGQYERSLGGVSPQEIKGLNLQQQLKGVVIPDQTKLLDLKQIIQFKQIDALAGLEIAQLTGIKTATALKSDIKLKSSLQVKDTVKVAVDEDVILKTAQEPVLKTSPALKSQLKSLLDIGTTAPTINQPVLTRPPKIPNLNPPIPKPFVIPFLKAKIQSGRVGGVPKSVYDQAYLPDFTSRALGLEAETLSQKQAQRRLKKLLTGLEIRRSVKIR